MICVPGLGLDRDRLAVAELGGADDDLDLALLQQAGDAAGQPADDAVLPGDRLREVELGRADARCRAGSSPAAMCATLSNSSAAWISALEGMQPTLRQTPPRLLRLDDHGVDAELSGADRADIAAGPGADDQQLAGDFFHLSPRRKSSPASPAAS